MPFLPPTHTHLFWRESFQECLNEEKTKSLSTSPLRCHGNDMGYSHLGYFPLELSRFRDDHSDLRGKIENAIFFLKHPSQKQSTVLSWVFCVLIHWWEKKHLDSSSQACPDLCENLLNNLSVITLTSLTSVLEKQYSSSSLCIISSNLRTIIFKESGLEVHANVLVLTWPLKF